MTSDLFPLHPYFYGLVHFCPHLSPGRYQASLHKVANSNFCPSSCFNILKLYSTFQAPRYFFMHWFMPLHEKQHQICLTSLSFLFLLDVVPIFYSLPFFTFQICLFLMFCLPFLVVL